MPQELIGVVRSQSALLWSEVDRLRELFVCHYDRVDPEAFDSDLREKDWVLELRDRRGTIRGFTTMKLYDQIVGGRRVRAVFSGNTIIDPAFWGEQALVRTFCRFMAQLKHAEPQLPLYWYLICSGYRTYMFLPLFFRRFYPHFQEPAPVEQELAEHFGRLKFPDEYRDGVVHVLEPRECLRSELAEPPESKLRNPHVRYFLETNSGYRRGNELVCMAEFSLDNNRRTAHQALLDAAGGLAC